MPTKSVSTSPDGLMPMSIIIFVIALTFSARYGASLAGAEPNAFAQIAEMYSASDRGLADLTLRYAVATTAPTAIAARCEPTDKRKIDDIAQTPMLRRTTAHSPFWIGGEYIVLRRNLRVACVATLCPALRKLGGLKGVGCCVISPIGIGPSVRVRKSFGVLLDERKLFQGVGHVDGIG